jgi:hypothetical protein
MAASWGSTTKNGPRCCKMEGFRPLGTTHFRVGFVELPSSEEQKIRLNFNRLP